jgi:hypothetical protein
MHPGVLSNGADPIGTMQALSGEALLAAWERGSTEAPPVRALTVLRAGCPALAETDAATLPLATRDIALLALHAQSFGPALAAFAACDACGERLEFTLQAAEIAATLQAAEAEFSLAHEGGTLRLRMANTRDIAEAAAAPDLDAAHALLLARCVTSTEPAMALPDAALARLEAMHDAAEISLSLACPACEARQAIHFDIASFLWAEIRHAARNLLDEVHELAWAYGWAESAILAMSPARRAAYLDRVRG